MSTALEDFIAYLAVERQMSAHTLDAFDAFNALDDLDPVAGHGDDPTPKGGVVTTGPFFGADRIGSIPFMRQIRDLPTSLGGRLAMAC